MYNLTFCSNQPAASIYSGVINAPQKNITTNTKAPAVQPQAQNVQTSEPDKKSFFKKAKSWLFDPVDNPDYVKGIQGAKPKTTRFQMYTGYALLALIWGFLFYTMYKDNKSLTKGLDETQRTLANMGNKAQNATSFMSRYKEDLDKTPRLKNLALPDVLKNTIDRLMNRIENPESFIQKGGVTNNAILLYGPPGTGKTTVAKAIAKELENTELFSVDLSTIQGKYVGESEANLDKIIKNVCQYAKENAQKKIVLLMDEFDSIAIDDKGSGNQQYHASILNVLKRAISEKLAQHDNVILIATTNAELNKTSNSGAIQTLNSAIADRFGEQIRVNRPSKCQFAKAIADHYNGLTKVEDTLKDEASAQVQDIAKQLEDNKCSFRTLNTLFKNSAETKGEKLTVGDVLKTLKDLIGKSEKEKQVRPMGFIMD